MKTNRDFNRTITLLNIMRMVNVALGAKIVCDARTFFDNFFIVFCVMKVVNNLYTKLKSISKTFLLHYLKTTFSLLNITYFQNTFKHFYMIFNFIKMFKFIFQFS